ncbi:MAG: putative Ig domain-containing protein [Bryobacteraceae bacterium]
MKRLAWLLLLPLAGGALFGQEAYTITGTVPSTGTIGVYYSASLSVSPAAQAAWSLYMSSLPPGLSLSPTSGTSGTATISGIPTTAGTYPFTVLAVIGGEIYVTGNFSITIAAPTLSLVSTSLPDGAVGVSYSQNLTAVGGYGPGTYQFTLIQGSTLPPGLQLSSSGLIFGTPTTGGSYEFAVQVISISPFGGNPATASAEISINISAPPLTLTTTSLPAGSVGVPYSQTLAASGGFPPYAWQLSSGNTPGGLTLNQYSGTISGTPATAGSFSFQVKVYDSQQGSATGSFTIRIAAGAFTITTSSLPAGTVGTAYTATTLAATGGTPPYTWSASGLPSGLSISSAGVISGTPTASGTFSVTVQATDSAQVTATKAYSVTVAAATAPLSITTQAPLAGGEVGVAYTQAFAATGGTPPYTWSASGLPSGLSISSAGVISGTPAASGSFPVTVQATDSAKATATKSFTITVTALTITTATLPNGTVGTSYTATTLAATGGTPPYTWSASGLPSGLSISSAGVISGTPAVAGSFSVTLKVTDSAQATATQTFTITVAAALTITTATLPNATVGTPYSQTLTASGSGTFAWSVSTGALPAGITLSSAGSLSGTPTAPGTFTFTVSVTGGGQSATQSFTITVTAALTITTATLPNGTVGTAYSQTLTAAGGSGALTWSISTGALPGGITLSSAGSLSGTPTAPGTFTFTVGVTGGGQSASKSFTITVGVPAGPPATITGLPATATPATQPALGIGIPSAYPLDITGTVTLTFAPDSPSPDGQEVVFTTGGRTASFTVAANSTQVVFPGGTPSVQIGTVSGTITLTLTLTAAGIDVTPSPAPSTKMTVAKSVPFIKTATVTGVTSSGFNLVVVGYATSREMVSATVGFTAASGVTLASSTATVSLATVFTNWYQSTPSAAYGSNFSLTIPFTFTNSTNPLTSVSVMLTNAVGNSTTVSAVY